MRPAAIAPAIFLCSMVLGTGLGAPAAQAAHCRLALILAIDVSSSVDAAEDRLQRAGIAAALQSPEVVSAFLDAPGSVALHAFEWSGPHHQATVLEWTSIETREDLEVASGIIRDSVRRRDDLSTAIGRALGHSAERMAQAPDCAIRKVDLSGDGPNNDGYPPGIAYGAFGFDDVVVNGLAILGAGSDNEIDLVEYYRAEVLHGPGAFLEIADGFDDFARAIRRKLAREVAEQALSRGEAPSFATWVNDG